MLNERVIYDVSGWKPGIVLGLLLSYFVLFGVIIGAKGVLWADLLLALRLSEGTFGSALLVSPLISVGLLLMGGQLSAWFGKKALALAGITTLAGAVLALGGAGSLWALVGALALTGVGNGLLEMAMNSATLDWEQATKRNMLNVMHAGFSAGAVLGAFGAGVLLGFGWTYSQVLWVLAVLCGAAIVATLPVRYPPAQAAGAAPPGASATLRVLLQRSILALAVLALLGIVGESVANTWSVIYLRMQGAEAFVGGAAFALFNGAMFAGRLANAPLVSRLGARVSLSVSGFGLILATALLMLPGNLSLSIAAFALMGLAVAGVIPTALTAASRLAPEHSDTIAGSIMAAAYVGLIICPPLVGWLAELLSLQIAMLSVGVSGLGVIWLAGAARNDGRRTTNDQRPTTNDDRP